MRPKTLILFFTTFCLRLTPAQAQLPITEFPGSKVPVIIYFSGDGGLNTFSNNLCVALQGKGFSVSAVDSRSYFWKKKSPEKTIADLNRFLIQKRNAGIREVYLVGYSFGADVIPFILGKPAEPVRAMVRKVILISPSTSTDLEIHLGDMLGHHIQRSMDVPLALQQLGWLPVHCILGKEETDFPASSIHLPTFTYQYLDGGHHYNSDIKLLSDIIIGKL